jgi:hypothetical protein
LNASQLTAGTVPDARLGETIARTSNVWLLGGNAGTDPLSQYIGTSDATPLVIGAGGQGILRLEGDLNGLRIIAGRSQVLDSSSTNSAILSGRQNTIQGAAHESVIAGGLDNVIGPDQRSAFIGGGARNGILQDNQHAAIVGGRDNRIGTNTANAVIVGGTNNMIADNASNSFAAGWRSRVNHPGAFVVSDSQQASFASAGVNTFNIRAQGGIYVI